MASPAQRDSTLRQARCWALWGEGRIGVAKNLVQTGWQGRRPYTAPIHRPQSVSEGYGSAEEEG